MVGAMFGSGFRRVATLVALVMASTMAVGGCGGTRRRAERRAPEESPHVGTRRAAGGSREVTPTRDSTSFAADGRVAMTSDATTLSLTVERTRTTRGDFSLRGGFEVDGWTVQLVGFPARFPDHVGVWVRTPSVRAITYRDCPVRVMADGIMLADFVADDYEIRNRARGEYHETLKTIAPRDELSRMATASRVALRLCDTELRLGPEHRAVISEFLLRFEEELRWMTVEGAEGAPVQDLGAVPAEPTPTP